MHCLHVHFLEMKRQLGNLLLQKMRDHLAVTYKARLSWHVHFFQMVVIEKSQAKFKRYHLVRMPQ
jgi:hypothetical protein